MRGKTHCLEVWGDFACFTRPEMKVERFSYPVITPSASRGIFDAIYWKRSYGFYWQIEKVEILSPPRYIALRRNEVKGNISIQDASKWMKSKAEIEEPFLADDMDNELKGRTQRQTMALKDVHYKLYAHMRFRNGEANIQGHDAQFLRLAGHGKCFYQPFFGCREFPAYFELIEDTKIEINKTPNDYSAEIGTMLYDTFDLRKSNDEYSLQFISVFHASVRGGIMRVPPYESDDVLKPEG
ncbi:MAG: type I-C CRISPR-associated protein Cas5 [Nitrospinae bacterium RIFCSPLOWO2_12_FULL_45_22]|nr:MAG: type I-C CRISPR-associated protein Cas5 [Nitrospinae bacterium RIFCSPLOWO2_12_FULL_45_22]